jgi:hypothetical protein
MRIIKIYALVIALALPATTGAMEFQTPGTLGMGRVGVARTTDAYAAFWNPAGLAFYEKAFSVKFNAGAGVAINESLADNVDKISKLDLDKLSYATSTADTALQIQQKALDSTAEAVQALAIIDDMDKSKGTLTVNIDLALAFQYRNFALGISGTSEIGAGNVHIDRDNLRTGDSTSIAPAAQNATELVRALNGGIPPTVTTNNQSYFSQTQWQTIVNNIKTAVPAVSDAEAATLANKMGEQYAKNPPAAELTPDQLVSGLNLAAQSFSGGSIDKNKSTVDLVGIVLAEIPFAYGHKVDLGSMGKLGLGATLKIMQATVYGKQALIFQDFKDGSSDFTTKVKESKADSTTFGIDLGALWRYEGLPAFGPINVGFVAKNLNSPQFDGPVGTDANGDPMKYPDVKVKPQSRVGLAIDPLSWLSIAADMDLSKNQTVMKDMDSQNIGGGLEAHWSYAAIRLGMYKNLAETGSKPIITAGLGIGPHWLRLDIDAAASTGTGKYDGNTYPREAKVEFGLSTAF